ncbi:hypothetical protein B2J93_4418 [Marssonina coronariae]|uniref:Uncharacterized protein n=1 Tax=Diplocarpon coronariae TaxID=2795749 RepID=A0A218ZA10_9HELO|nr:hypothetical protein B2J93_4418 [Marssonina coronariae]
MARQAKKVNSPLARKSTQIQVTEILHVTQIALIEDLCYAVRSKQSIGDCLGYLSDGRYMHEFRPIPESETVRRESRICLAEVLSGRETSKPSQQKRLELATIPTSRLQLQETPWVVEKPEKRNMFFFQRDTATSSDHPYHAHFFPRPNGPQPKVTLTAFESRLVTRNSISNLGIYFWNYLPDNPSRTKSFVSTMSAETGMRTRVRIL